MKSSLRLPLLSLLGFTLVTLAAYGCWAFNAFHSPLVLYTACTVVFLILGSLSLYPLMRNSISWGRFLATYTLGFVAYAISWVALWSLFHNKLGELAGSFLGLALMTLVFRAGTGRPGRWLPSFLMLFAFHSIGYHLGEWIHQTWSHSHITLARLGWGLGHGLGFGAGLVATLGKQPEARPREATS